MGTLPAAQGNKTRRGTADLGDTRSDSEVAEGDDPWLAGMALFKFVNSAISILVLGVAAAIAYIVGIERAGREYDTKLKRRYSHKKAEKLARKLIESERTN